MQATQERNEAGFVLPIIGLVLMPLLLMVGTSVMLSNSRGRTSLEYLNQERMLLAAEAGIDRAIYLANLSQLATGIDYTYDLGAGMSTTFRAVDTLLDSVDNDGDTNVDEADERGFQVTSVGKYKGKQRRLVAHTRPMAELPVFVSALTLEDPNAVLSANGNAFTIDGNDHNIDGSPGPNAPIFGATVTNPGTVAGLLSGLSGMQQSRITGAGGTPSAGTQAPPDIDALADLLEPFATNVIAGGSYNAIPNFGSAVADIWTITHCTGSLELAGTQTGAGILIVDGDLDFRGNVTYVGIVIVRGKIRFSGGGSSKVIRGALMGGGDASLDSVFTLSGTVDLQYSSQGITKVSQLLTRQALAGWREVSRS